MDGVAQVIIAGEQQYAAHVQVNPVSLAAKGLGLEDVRNALVSATLDQPKGTLEGTHQTYTLDTNDQLFTADAYRNVIIAYRNGAPVRVKDIGDAIDSSQYPRTGAWFNGKHAELLLIYRQPGANTIAIVDKIKAIMPGLIDIDPARGACRSALGSLREHPRLGPGRRVHAAASPARWW